MTHLSPIENLFAIEVPLDAKDFELIPMPGRVVLKWVDEGRVDTTYLLPGSYEILFTTKDVKGMKARGIVECISMGGFGRSGEEWKDYNGDNLFRTAIESLRSLLRANSLDGSKNYLLIKKL